MALEHVAREHLWIAGANGIDEILVMRILCRRQAGGLAVEIRGVSAGTLLVLRSEIGLPLPPALLDPEPTLRTVEEIADPHACLVIRELPARPELEDCPVGVLEQAGLRVGR